MSLALISHSLYLYLILFIQKNPFIIGFQSNASGDEYVEPPKPKINWGMILADKEKHEKTKFARMSFVSY